MKNSFSVCLIVIVFPIALFAQKKKIVEKVNDSNTPLHLIQPDYSFPYGVSSISDVKSTLSNILEFLGKETPAEIIDKTTGKVISDCTTLNTNAQLAKGSFRLSSYEWGVTYAGMLDAAEATGDSLFANYVSKRFHFFERAVPYFKRLMDEDGIIDPQMKPMLDPRALDDAGSICASMIKASSIDSSLHLRSVIDNYINYIMYSQYRLSDGTFARNRPQHNTLWLDDMYMSLPALAQMSNLTSDDKYLNEATRQIKQFASRMFVPEKGFFRHGWVEGMDEHPSFFWARANGWAMMTLTEVLDVLPKSNPDRSYILELLKSQIKSIAACQSGEGLWHQLLDRSDSYLETSASAIYVYCIAKAINERWIDAKVYGPVAQLGWNALSKKVNAEGEVEGTCVGTGMAFDPAYYYHRPVNVYAAHGYGPVLLAGAEMIKMLKGQHPKMNDSAVQFYDTPYATNAPIFEVNDTSRPENIQSGSSRKHPKAPVVFLIGDSTVKNGRGKGDGGLWGWGSFFEQFFDTTRISIENHALGGRSSRTFFTEGLWDNVLPGIQKGDYLLMQFGHNDGGPYNTGRARASIPGTSDSSMVVVMERNGGSETVYTYGNYLRLFIRQAKAKGAIPIVLSPTPHNTWTNGKIARMTNTYTDWAKEVSKEENVFFIDLNDISADKFDKMGEIKGKLLYKDSVHNNYDGAILNGESVVDGIRKISGLSLNEYLKK